MCLKGVEKSTKYNNYIRQSRLEHIIISIKSSPFPNENWINTDKQGSVMCTAINQKKSAYKITFPKVKVLHFNHTVISTEQIS